MGYSKKLVSGIRIDAKKREADVGIVKLEQSALKLNAVEISGYKSNVVYKIDKKVVDLSQAPAEAGATAAEALRNVPGVNVDLDGNVTLRGSSNFIVLIDGKPSAISAADILKQLPASSIEKIELVTNPSAKYEAEGATGIINVILKKGTQGFNGIVNVTAGTGDKYQGDFLFNIKKQKVNFFIGGNLRDTKGIRRYYWNTRTIRNTDTSIVTFDVNNVNHVQNYSFRAGLEYNFNIKNSLSISGEIGDNSIKSDVAYPQYKNITSDAINRYTMNNSVMSTPKSYYFFNLDYRHKFDINGHELIFSSYYSNGGGKAFYSNEEQLQTKSGQLLEYYFVQSQYDQDNTDQEIQAKADYTYPLDTTQKFETGLFAKFRPKSSITTSIDFDSNTNTWINNTAYTNQFDFYHNVYAGYLNYSKSWKKFEFMVGLRAEYSDRLLDLKISSEKYPYQKFDVFPSLSLVRKIGKMGQLQLSYSRRINRPNEDALNPFPEYSTNTIKIAGNPNLKPEYINSLQLNYMMGPLAVETYYRQVNDAVDDVFASDSTGGLYYIPDNIAKKIYYGLDLSGGAPLAKWCLMQLKFSIYDYQMQGSNVSSSIPGSSTAWTAFLGTRFIITKTSKFEAYGGYNSSMYNSQGKVDQFFFAGASFSQSFLKQMLTAKISINNPFNIFTFETNNSDRFTNSTLRMTREANVIKISLSYKINNYKPVKTNIDKPGNINGEGKF
jgi:outer membrane receptor protein involved in Fe transport